LSNGSGTAAQLKLNCSHENLNKCTENLYCDRLPITDAHLLTECVKLT